METNNFKNAYHVIMSAILAKANEIHSKTKLHTNDIEFVINKNMGTNNLENAYHIIMLAILAKANEIHSKIKLHTNDIEIVINNSIFENMKKIINDAEGKVINYTVDDNPDKIYYIGNLFGMKCFIDTTENSYSYQAYARYKNPYETKYHIEDINFLDGMDDAIKRFFV